MDTQDFLIFLYSFIFFLAGVLCSYGFIRIRKRYDGEITVFEDELGSKTFSIDLGDEDPWNLDKKKRVTFKINTEHEIS